MKGFALALALCALVPSARADSAQTPLTPAEQREVAQEAYVYLYPLVTMDVTRRQATNVEAGARAPANVFAHGAELPPPADRLVLRPSFDTLYSSAWLDLSSGPIVLTVPDTAGRYYAMSLLDQWTDVFASLGPRTTGTGAASFAVTPPGWSGTLPSGVTRIEAPTPHVWVLARTQVNGAADYEAVRAVQAGFALTALADWGQPPKPRAAAAIDREVDMEAPALAQVNAMPAAKYFSYAAEILRSCPPHAVDQPIVARMRRLGIEPGKDFDFDKAEPSVRRALAQGVADGQRLMELKRESLARVVNGWRMSTDTMGAYGTYYLKRAVVAMIGLGASLPEDAISPVAASDSGGKPLDGSHRYVLHFAKSELPPVNAFWSLALYDAQGFPVAETLKRFAIRDRDSLRYGKDGSLDLFVQKASPGKARESNWLPAPAGGFSLTLRLYSPRAEALDGRWAPPPLRRAK